MYDPYDPRPDTHYEVQEQHKKKQKAIKRQQNINKNEENHVITSPTSPVAAVIHVLIQLLNFLLK
jgi:hypothetical protein